MPYPLWRHAGADDAGHGITSKNLIQIDLPEWLLSIAYAFMGWRIGLGFTRTVLKHAVRALPKIIFSIILLIGFCGVLARLLVNYIHLDPLTAYLATSRIMDSYCRDRRIQ